MIFNKNNRLNLFLTGNGVLRLTLGHDQKQILFSYSDQPNLKQMWNVQENFLEVFITEKTTGDDLQKWVECWKKVILTTVFH
jgi:hypothetical protein